MADFLFSFSVEQAEITIKVKLYHHLYEYKNVKVGGKSYMQRLDNNEPQPEALHRRDCVSK